MVHVIRRGSRGTPCAGLLLCLGLLLALAGCSEQETPLGFDRGSRGAYVPEPVGFTAADSADLEVLPDRSTGLSLSILVGERTDGDAPAESRGFIRFGSIPDTTSMRHAYLRFHLKRGDGDTIAIAIRRVLGAWEPDSIRWRNRPAADSIAPLAERGNVPTRTVDLTTPFQLEDIEIPMALVREWVALPDSNLGLEIAPTRGNGMARFVSRIDVITDNNLSRIASPALILATDTTKTSTRSAMATGCAYAIRSLAPRPTGGEAVARVGAGPASRLLLRFDLSPLPSGASVVRGVLHLPLASGQASSDLSFRLLVFEVNEAWSEGVPPDTSGVAVRSSYDGIRDFSSSTASEITVDIGEMVQRWASGSTNYGLSIRLADETFAPRGLLLYTKEDPDSTHHPSLDVVYLPSPGGRLDGGAR